MATKGCTSERDMNILECIKRGMSNSEISAAFEISKHSVRHVVRRLRARGYDVPHRNPMDIVRNRKAKAQYTPNLELIQFQKELGAIQTGTPEQHLLALQRYPAFKDVVFKKVMRRV